MMNKPFQLEAGILKALAHPIRLKILEKLKDGPCCVCKIIPYVGGEQSNVSHHLAILKQAGIVRDEKRGTWVWYEVSNPEIFEVIDRLKAYIRGYLEREGERIKEQLRRR